MIDELNRLIEQKLEQSHLTILDRLLGAKEIARFNRNGLQKIHYSDELQNKTILIGTIDEIKPKTDVWKYSTYALAFWNYRPVLCDVDLLQIMDLTETIEFTQMPHIAQYRYNPTRAKNYWDDGLEYIVSRTDRIYYELGYSVAHHDLGMINRLHTVNSATIIMEDYDARRTRIK